MNTLIGRCPRGVTDCNCGAQYCVDRGRRAWDGWESNEAAHRLCTRALSYLRLFGPDTYGIHIPHDLAVFMKQRGWVEWQPPKFGTTLYAITEDGRVKVAK